MPSEGARLELKRVTSSAAGHRGNFNDSDIRVKLDLLPIESNRALETCDSCNSAIDALRVT